MESGERSALMPENPETNQGVNASRGRRSAGPYLRFRHGLPRRSPKAVFHARKSKKARLGQPRRRFDDGIAVDQLC